MRGNSARILDGIFHRLSGRTAWISGGKRIGQAVARALAEQGVNLIVTYRSSEKEAGETVKEAKSLGRRAVMVQADVSNPSDMERALRLASKTFPKIDILVNLASVFKNVPFENITPADWKSNIDAHILGTFWPSRIISPRMPRGSHIVNVADRTTLGRVYPKYLPYVATKHAVEGLTRALAVELAPKGIFVNAIAPGPILKPDDIPQKEWNAYRKKSRLKFTVTDKEAVDQFAFLVLYLCTVTLTSGNTYSLDQGHNL